MSHQIVFVAGSPSGSSRSSSVARALAGRLEAYGRPTRWFSIRDFDSEDVMLARAEAPALKHFVEVVRGAAALVLSTPVYKATYAGALKAVVDLIPPDALIDKPTLGIGTSRLADHGGDLARAFGALFAFFRARSVGALVVLDDELTVGEGGVVTFAAAAEDRLAAAARALALAVDEPVQARTAE
jgi:FMN reductase